MGVLHDLTGQKFNRLTAIRFVKMQGGSSIWLWKCDCGREKEIGAAMVKRGSTQSCRCLHREKVAEVGKATRKHGMCKRPEYMTYHAMLQRCNNKKNHAYDDYGGRGIKVCARWQGPKGFENFYKDMGPKPSSNRSIDREDNDGNYEPSNCKWGTQKEQHDHRRNTVMLTYNGDTKPLVDWINELGLSKPTVFDRYYRKLPPEQILFQGRLNGVRVLTIKNT